MPRNCHCTLLTRKRLLIYEVLRCRIIEAGTYLNSTRHIFPDWGNATILDAKACYESADKLCVVPGGVDEADLRVTAMRLNETGLLYTRTYVDEDRVWVAYVEEPFDV